MSQQPHDEILDAITALLPIPAVLVRDGGRIGWMNHAARIRFGCSACSLSSPPACLNGTSRLAELVAYIGHERSGSLVANVRRRAPSLKCLLPGEFIVLRAIELGDAPRCVLACLCASPEPQTAAREGLERELGLSSREKEIALRAVEGYSVLGIATELGIAESTVCTHLKRIYRKLGVCSRAELAWRIVREPHWRATTVT